MAAVLYPGRVWLPSVSSNVAAYLQRCAGHLRARRVGAVHCRLLASREDSWQDEGQRIAGFTRVLRGRDPLEKLGRVEPKIAFVGMLWTSVEGVLP